MGRNLYILPLLKLLSFEILCLRGDSTSRVHVLSVKELSCKNVLNEQIFRIQGTVQGTMSRGFPHIFQGQLQVNFNLYRTGSKYRPSLLLRFPSLELFPGHVQAELSQFIEASFYMPLSILSCQKTSFSVNILSFVYRSARLEDQIHARMHHKSPLKSNNPKYITLDKSSPLHRLKTPRCQKKDHKTHTKNTFSPDPCNHCLLHGAPPPPASGITRHSCPEARDVYDQLSLSFRNLFPPSPNNRGRPGPSHIASS